MAKNIDLFHDIPFLFFRCTCCMDKNAVVVNGCHKLFDYTHSSKYPCLCSAEKKLTGLEQVEGE